MDDSRSHRTESSTLLLLIASLLVVITVVAYWQVGGFEFIPGWDDGEYISGNPVTRNGLTTDGFLWAFRTFHLSNWHPLTWLSHMADVELFGLRPGWHHRVNVAFHVLNAVLLFLVLTKTTGSRWRSGFAAALFAIHPLHVESVAWLSERKDVLSTLFWMLAMGFYAGYVRRPGIVRYGFVLAALVLGLLAKAMLVSFPFVMLLLDFWPLKRLPSGPLSAIFLDGRRLFAEKIPLFAVAATSAAVTYVAQARGGAVMPVEIFPIDARVANSLVSYFRYLGKTVWPASLSAFYPHPLTYGQAIPFWTAVAAGLGLVAITISALRAAPRFPYLPVGWLWFLGTALPVIGIIQLEGHAIADRYTYIPLVGIFIIAAWGGAALLENLRVPPKAAGLLAALILVTLGIACRQQVAVWRNGETLFRHAIAVTPDNWLAHDNLGAVLMGNGRVREAMTHFREALRIRPRSWSVHSNLGVALAVQGRHEEAAAHFIASLRIFPGNDFARHNLGCVFEEIGMLNEAAEQFREVLRINPGRWETRSRLGSIYLREGNYDEAIREFGEAIQRKPDEASLHDNLGRAVLLRNRHGNRAGP